MSSIQHTKAALQLANACKFCHVLFGEIFWPIANESFICLRMFQESRRQIKQGWWLLQPVKATPSIGHLFSQSFWGGGGIT